MDLVAYLRVSSVGQADEGYGLDVQEHLMRAWADSNGHVIVRVCRDVISGTVKTTEREGFQCALEALNSGDAKGLLIARLDRLGRELTIQESTLAALWRNDVTVFAADQGEIPKADPDDPMRNMVRKMMGLFAELDREMLVKRMRDGRKYKAAQGKKAVGSYPYGYEGRGKGRDRDAAPRDDERPAIDIIMRLRSDGATYRDIVAALDSAGIAPRKASSWSPMTVRNIYQREARL